MLRVRLLGGFDLSHGGSDVPLAESARAQSLLAYLVLHRDAARSRQQLAFLLWPDSTEAQARTNLRHVLHNLRRALPEPDRFIEVAAQTLRWRPDAPVWIDVVSFEDCLARADLAADTDARLAALREAIDLYRGDLLTGSWEEWLLAARERLRHRYLAALDRLVGLLESRGDLSAAIGFAHQLVREDPLQEEPYRILMRLHAATGDRGRAVRAYHACVTALERELGVAPSAATVKAYEVLVAAGEDRAEVPPRPERLAGPALVGRAAEASRLSAAWNQAREGRAHLVLVTGEPGVGKTRLVEELAAACAHQGVLVVTGRSYAAEGALAYGLLITWLRSEALAGSLARLAPADTAELAQLLPELAGGPLRDRAHSPSEERRRLFDAATRAVLVSGQPTLLVADDLHWADAESLQFLHYLVRVAPAAPILVAATARREELPALAALGAGLHAMERLTELDIDRLTPEETRSLAELLSGGSLEPRVTRQLYELSEGNPLFVVETLRTGWDGSPAHALAPRLQAVIRARLEQLSPSARELLGLAATIGREFASDVIGAASEAGDETTVAALDELWRRGILRERGAEAYDFSHDRIREVAYADLGPARRRRHHQRVADALLATGATGQQGRLAAHLEQAGRIEEAVGWYVRAADAAQSVYAYEEAVRLLERAAALLARLPPDAGRMARLADILSAVPALFSVLDGYTSPRLVAAQERAMAAIRAADVPATAAVVLSVALTSLSRGDFVAARRHAEQLIDRGERDGDEVVIVEGRYLLGVTAFWRGELALARAHLEAAIADFWPEKRAIYIGRFGHDTEVVCRGRLANTLLLLGHAGLARQAHDAALELARRLDHPFTTGIAHVFAGLFAVDLGDRDGLRAAGAGLAAIGEEYMPLPLLVMRDALAGLVAVHDGAIAEGLARVERAIEAVREVNPAPGSRDSLFRILVAAHRAAGSPAAEGIAAVDRALAGAGEVRLWEPELRRARADFLAAAGAPPTEVEAERARAQAVSREQGRD